MSHIWTNFTIFDQISPYLTKFHHIWPNFIIFDQFSSYLTKFHHIWPSPNFRKFNQISPYLNKFHLIWTNFTILNKFHHIYYWVEINSVAFWYVLIYCSLEIFQALFFLPLLFLHVFKTNWQNLVWLRCVTMKTHGVYFNPIIGEIPDVIRVLI